MLFGSPAIAKLLSGPKRKQPFRTQRRKGRWQARGFAVIRAMCARWLSPQGDQALARRAAPQGALCIRLGPASAGSKRLEVLGPLDGLRQAVQQLVEVLGPLGEVEMPRVHHQQGRPAVVMIVVIVRVNQLREVFL